jgi:prepilin-type N-terminal cleavage/methylation domain-containing protein
MNGAVSRFGFRVSGSALRSGVAGRLRPSSSKPEAPNAKRDKRDAKRRGAVGFTLMELLVAIFVLSLAVAGTIGVIYAAGRSTDFTRERAVAATLADAALADALYAAEDYRENHGGVLDFGDAPFTAAPYSQKPDDALGPAGCQKTGYRKKGGATDFSYGWLWRAHSFDAATGLYSLDVWVFRHPSEPSVAWGYAKDSTLKRRQTLFYLRARLGGRRP